MTSRLREGYAVPELHLLQIVVEPPGTLYSYLWSDSLYRKFSDYVDESFHARSRAGEVFNNPCALILQSVTCSSGEDSTYVRQKVSAPAQTVTKTVGNFTTYGYLRSAAPIQSQMHLYALPVPRESECESICKQHAVAHIDQTPYEFFEDLAEIRETLQFLRNPIKSLANLAKAYKISKRKLTKKSVKHEAKALADLWNTYRFAAAPLVRSIMTALEAYNERDIPMRTKRRSAHGKCLFTSDDAQSDTQYKGAYEEFKYSIARTAEIAGHASILYEVDNPLDNWSFRLGLRLKDIPVTAWEVVPLSFMVDRIVNIKQAIAGLTNLLDPTVSILAASYTTKITQSNKCSLTDIVWADGSYNVTITNPDYVEHKNFYYTREVWSPTVSDTFPTFTPGGLVKDFSSTLDLLAITVSRFL